MNFRQHTAEDDSGSDPPGCVLCLFCVVLEGATEMELSGGVYPDGLRRIRDFQRVVTVTDRNLEIGELDRRDRAHPQSRGHRRMGRSPFD